MSATCLHCPQTNQCATRYLACRAMVYQGVRGDNPSRHWYLELYDSNVDGTNRYLAYALRKGQAVNDIVDWLLSSVSPLIYRFLNYPLLHKHHFIRRLWRYFPFEQLTLSDFVPYVPDIQSGRQA